MEEWRRQRRYKSLKLPYRVLSPALSYTVFPSFSPILNRLLLAATGIFNVTCPLSKAEIDRANVEKPIVGDITLQRLMFYISCGFTILAAGLGIFLAITNLRCWVRPREQRQIIRIAFYPVTFCPLGCFSVYSLSRFNLLLAFSAAV